MHQFGLRVYQPGLSRTAEYLFKIQILTFVGKINQLIRMEIRHTILDGCKVGGIVKGGSVGF